MLVFFLEFVTLDECLAPGKFRATAERSHESVVFVVTQLILEASTAVFLGDWSMFLRRQVEVVCNVDMSKLAHISSRRL